MRKPFLLIILNQAKIIMNMNIKYDPIYSVNCWARDKEHAEKIALDKYYQWKWEKVTEVMK